MEHLHQLTRLWELGLLLLLLRQQDSIGLIACGSLWLVLLDETDCCLIHLRWVFELHLILVFRHLDG